MMENKTEILPTEYFLKAQLNGSPIPTWISSDGQILDDNAIEMSQYTDNEEWMYLVENGDTDWQDMMRETLAGDGPSFMTFGTTGALLFLGMFWLLYKFFTKCKGDNWHNVGQPNAPVSAFWKTTILGVGCCSFMTGVTWGVSTQEDNIMDIMGTGNGQTAGVASFITLGIVSFIAIGMMLFTPKLLRRCKDKCTKAPADGLLGM